MAVGRSESRRGSLFQLNGGLRRAAALQGGAGLLTPHLDDRRSSTIRGDLRSSEAAGSGDPRTAPPWSAAARRSPPFDWNFDAQCPSSATIRVDWRTSSLERSTSSFQMDGGRCRATALQGRRTAIALTSPAASLSPLSSRWASALCPPWRRSCKKQVNEVDTEFPRSAGERFFDEQRCGGHGSKF